MKWYIWKSIISGDGRYEMDVERRIVGNRIIDALVAFTRWRNVSRTSQQDSRIYGANAVNRFRNEIHRMSATSEDITMRMEKNVLRRLGHDERMGKVKMAKKIYEASVSGK